MYQRSSAIPAAAVAPGTATRTEARRLVGIASIFVWVRWLMVIYAAFGGLLWWIDLSSLENLTLVEALGLSLDVVAGPLFLALLVAGLGHCARLFALYVADHSSS